MIKSLDEVLTMCLILSFVYKFSDKEETGLSFVEIVLLIVGGFVLIAGGIVLAVACYYCIRKRRDEIKNIPK